MREYALFIFPYVAWSFFAFLIVWIFFKLYDFKKEEVNKKVKAALKEVKRADSALNKKQLSKDFQIYDFNKAYVKLKEIVENLEKKEDLFISFFEAAFFFKVYPGRILKSDDGKYFLINKEELKHLKLSLGSDYIKHQLKNALEEIEEEFVEEYLQKDTIELDANELLYVLRNNLLPKDKTVQLSSLFSNEVEIKSVGEKDFEKVREIQDDSKKKDMTDRYSIIEGREGSKIIFDNETLTQYIAMPKDEKNKEEKNKTESKSNNLELELLKTLEAIYLELKNSQNTQATIYKQIIELVKNQKNLDEKSISSLKEVVDSETIEGDFSQEAINKIENILGVEFESVKKLADDLESKNLNDKKQEKKKEVKQKVENNVSNKVENNAKEKTGSSEDNRPEDKGNIKANDEILEYDSVDSEFDFFDDFEELEKLADELDTRSEVNKDITDNKNSGSYKKSKKSSKILFE